MKHTALYLRVSTEAQADEGYSLAAQAEKLEAYCRMKGIGRFTQYVDGGFSGSNQIGRASCREECRSRWSPYH